MWLAFYMHMRTGAPDARTEWHGWVAAERGYSPSRLRSLSTCSESRYVHAKDKRLLGSICAFHDSEGSTFISALQYNDRGIAGSTANLSVVVALQDGVWGTFYVGTLC